MRRRQFCQHLAAGVLAAGLPLRHAVAAVGDVPGAIEAITGTGAETLLPQKEVLDFGRSLHGPLLLPGHEGYDSARRVWNGMFDKQPALIARCSGAGDVVKAVQFARANNLLVAVKGGGHSMSGKSTCEGGLMIDLSAMRGVRVDPWASTAQVEPGTLLGQFDEECQAFGLATTMGTDPDTGAAGLTLGGGFGRLGREYGMACDNVRSVDIVTADGQLRRASADREQDLFWAVRGGGGNFGVVTSFEYQLHRIGTEILAGKFVYPLAKAREAMALYAEFMPQMPREFAGALVYILPPGQPDKPRGLAVFSFTYTGDPARGEQLVAPMRKALKPAMAEVMMKPYVEVQRRETPLPRGDNYYMKSGFMSQLDDAFLDTIINEYRAAPTRATTALITQLGGRISDIDPAATAFPHRDAQYDFLIASNWKNAAYSPDNVAYMRGFWERVAPYSNGFYVNSAMDVDDQKIRQTYRDNYPRLVSLKNRYDPGNLFQLNTNIRPTV